MKIASITASLTLGACFIAGAVPAASADPLAGPWQCRLMFRYTGDESAYRSAWRFDPARGQVEIRLSPIHRPLRLAYRWDGRRLLLDPPHAAPGANGQDAYLDRLGQLVVDQPEARWKGWVCAPTPAPVAWAEPAVYRDARRYPWLRDVAETVEGYGQK